jgi:hypothetical protein
MQLYMSVLEPGMSKFEQKRIFPISIIKYGVPQIRINSHNEARILYGHQKNVELTGFITPAL